MQSQWIFSFAIVLGNSTHSELRRILFAIFVTSEDLVGCRMTGMCAHPSETDARFDAFLPPVMAERAEAIGHSKVHMGARKTWGLAVLAGAFIGMGAMFATLVGTGAETLPFGLAKLVMGLAFCLGLILVVVAGAELFTGNNLIVMAVAARKVSISQLLRNWGIVYLGNFVGSLGTAFLVFASGQYQSGGAKVGSFALRIAQSKCQLDFFEAVVRGILCNSLVCLAVWLCLSARSTTDKILCIIFPITAFVAAGFEHSVANMYFVPLALLIKSWAPNQFWSMSGSSSVDYLDLNCLNFLIMNLLPVTLGNILGGACLVALVYWFIYLRDE